MKAATKAAAVAEEGQEAALQDLLADLVVLSLHSKQAHWNVTGPQFSPLHELFDRMADEHRAWYDLVAERLRALDAPADGRVFVLAGSSVEEMPAGPLPGERAAALLHERVEGTAFRARAALGPLGEADPVTQDMVIGIVEGLEKQAWILRVQAR